MGIARRKGSFSKNRSKKKLESPKKKKQSSSEESESDDVPEDHYKAAHGTKFGNMHEKDNKVIKAETSKWDNDWDKIEKERAKIKAIKEKKRISKLQAENQLLERNKAKKDTSKKFHNASHEKAPKKQAALSSKWDNDWEKIEKQRAEIKAIKEKKKKEKMEKDNILKERNKKKKETDKKFKNAHE